MNPYFKTHLYLPTLVMDSYHVQFVLVSAKTRTQVAKRHNHSKLDTTGTACLPNCKYWTQGYPTR
jgi:hypothetical protein